MAKKSVKGAGQKSIQNIANVNTNSGTPKVDIPALPYVPKHEIETVKSVQGITEETTFDRTSLPSTKLTKNIEPVEDIHKARKKAVEEISHPKSKKPVEKLSEEELHRRRVEAGKKAWKNRTKDWTAEDFRKYAEQFKENVNKSANKREIPTVSNVELVYEAILNLERDVKGDTRDFGIEGKKYTLMSIMDDVVNSEMEYHDYPYDYDDYLAYYMEEIAYHLHIIAYDSDAEEIQRSFVRLARLLNQGALNLWQANYLSDISEFVQTDIDWDDLDKY